MTERTAIWTPCSEADLCTYLHDGHVKAFATEPSVERLGFAWSQMALEMGRGAKIRCFNYGNITATKSWTGDYFTLHVPPPDPPVLRFRAYDGHVEGAAGYWTFMAQRFPTVFAMYDSGDAYSMAMKLGEVHYYLANRETYSKAVANLYAEFIRRYPSMSSPWTPSVSELTLAEALWRLSDEVTDGLEGIDAIDKVVKS